MRTSKLLMASSIVLALMPGVAFAAGNGGFGGTPDAQNGAQGRNNPTSYYGHRNDYSGRSVGFGRGYGAGYVRPYGYRHRRPYYPAW